MARTKQTARMAVVRQAPKNKGVKKPHRFRPGGPSIQGLGNGKVGCSAPNIDSDSDS
jgi:hypothetical protein